MAKKKVALTAAQKAVEKMRKPSDTKRAPRAKRRRQYTVQRDRELAKKKLIEEIKEGKLVIEGIVSVDQEIPEIPRPEVDEQPPTTKNDPELRRLHLKEQNYRRKTGVHIEKMIESAMVRKKELALLEADVKKLEERKRLLDATPNPADQRKILNSLFVEADLDPIQELIDYCKDEGIPKREKVPILKLLAEYRIAKPKTVDTDRENQMHVEVTTMSFGNSTQAEMTSEMDPEYSEFIGDAED